MIYYVLKLEVIPRCVKENSSGNDSTVIISTNFVLPLTTLISHVIDKDANDNQFIDCKCKEKCLLDFSGPTLRLAVDGQVFSRLMTLLEVSRTFRTKFLKRVFECQLLSSSNYKHKECKYCQEMCLPCTLQVTLLWPEKLIIDYSWNYRIKDLVFEFSELENLSAWLSTLGGAFSSLGENSLMFADKAQLTSVHQMKIAHMLSNPLLMSRCRLYYAIALLQKNELRTARKIVENEYKFAKSKEGKMDFKLSNMCLGIWAKLKYLHQQNKHCIKN